MDAQRRRAARRASPRPPHGHGVPPRGPGCACPSGPRHRRPPPPAARPAPRARSRRSAPATPPSLPQSARPTPPAPGRAARPPERSRPARPIRSPSRRFLLRSLADHRERSQPERTRRRDRRLQVLRATGQPQGSPLRCQHDAHGSPGGRTRDQWVLPAIRATTHVDGKPIRSSRRARRGAGCWLRRTIGASGRTPMLSGRMTWRRASAARRPLIGRACPDGRRGGGGVRSGTLRTITRCSTAAAGVRPRSRSPARARAARSRVVRSGRRLGPVETPAYQRSSCAAAQGAFQPLLRFVQRASDRAIKRGARDDSFRQGAAVARWASTARPERSRAATTLAAACRGKASVIPLLGAMCRRPCRSARAPSWR